LGARSYTVRGIYGNSPVSSPYNLTRVNPLSFGSNRTLATSNYHVAQNRPPANPDSSATYTQTASGGSGGVVKLYYAQGGGVGDYNFGLSSAGFSGKLTCKLALIFLPEKVLVETIRLGR